ncbi:MULTISPECIES: YsgD/CorL family protein [Erwinia]|uniref:YsgD/CorL family protein n=2 Tax=Erwinia TaxID=551 RepID=A0ABV4EDS9_9GAMM
MDTPSRYWLIDLENRYNS